MDIIMKKITLRPFVKYIVLKIGLFESEIIDEANFSANDKAEIMKFERKYIDRDDCYIAKVDM